MANNGIDSLTPLALAIVSLAIIVSVGAIVLGTMQPAAYAENAVTDEAHTPTEPLPTNFTVDKASDANFESIEDDTVTVVFEDSSAGTNTTLEQSTDYVVFNDVGNIEAQDSTALTDYNDSEDTLYTDYTWNEDAAASGVLQTGSDALQTFADFFTVIIIIGIAAVLFLLLRVVRRNGQTVGA